MDASARFVGHYVAALTSQVAAAEADLMTAAFTAPMHGLIQCIRVLVEASEDPSGRSDDWRHIVSHILALVRRAMLVAYPIVCTTSPEGFLPDDGDDQDDPAVPVPDEANGEHDGPSDAGRVGGERRLPSECESSTSSHGTLDDTLRSQALLACCWRTLKETALLLSALFDSLMLARDAVQTSVCTVADVCGIGETILQLLLAARHRGVVDTLQGAFTTLCSRLTSVPDQDLRGLPSTCMIKIICGVCMCAVLLRPPCSLHGLSDDPCTPGLWLERVLQRLVAVDAGSVTRRSAGYPRILLAVLTTDAAIASGLLSATLSRLVGLAGGWRCAGPAEGAPETIETPGAGTEAAGLANGQPAMSLTAAIHAMNILRFLVVDARIVVALSPWLASLVALAIRGFAALDFAVRNSATMLFTALLGKMFGVKRVRDEHAAANRLTAREFFLRYPALHELAMHTLAEASWAVGSERRMQRPPPTLYPVLVVLGRLLPSSMEGLDAAGLAVAPLRQHLVDLAARSATHTHTHTPSHRAQN